MNWVSGKAVGLVLAFVLSGIAAASAAVHQESWRTSNDSANLRDYYYPGTEQLRPDEMRVVALGTGMPAISKGQAAASFLVQLGNGDNFIFDLGTGSLGNLIALQIPWNTTDKVFLGHLHFDHMGDLAALMIVGVSHGRNVPLNIWGPSGKTHELGTKYSIEHLVKAFNWELSSKRGLIPGTGYRAIVHEFDYSKVQTVYEQNGVVIKSWPAVHVTDGPVSYSLEWNGLKFVFSSDTVPNKWFIENGKDADIVIHESFPSINQLIFRDQMLPEAAWPVGTRVHTQPAAAGRVFSIVKPRMAVAYHFIHTPETHDEVYSEIRTTYDGPLTLAQDLMVWNITKDDIVVRQAVVPSITYPSKEKTAGAKVNPKDRVAFLSDWLEKGRLNLADIDLAIWRRLSPAIQERIRNFAPALVPAGAETNAPAQPSGK